jgi:hypothetical protein
MRHGNKSRTDDIQHLHQVVNHGVDEDVDSEASEAGPSISNVLRGPEDQPLFVTKRRNSSPSRKQRSDGQAQPAAAYHFMRKKPLSNKDQADSSSSNSNPHPSNFQFFAHSAEEVASSSHHNGAELIPLSSEHRAEPATVSIRVQPQAAHHAANHRAHAANMFNAAEPQVDFNLTVEKINIGIAKTQEIYTDWKGTFTPIAPPAENLLHPSQLGTVTFAHETRKNDPNNFSCDVYPDQIIAHQHTPFNEVAYKFMIATLTANLPEAYPGVKPVAIIEILPTPTNLDDAAMAKLVTTIIAQGHVPVLPELRLQSVLTKVQAQAPDKLEALLDLLPNLPDEQSNETSVELLRTVAADLLRPLSAEVTLGEH